MESIPCIRVLSPHPLVCCLNATVAQPFYTRSEQHIGHLACIVKRACLGLLHLDPCPTPRFCPSASSQRSLFVPPVVPDLVSRASIFCLPCSCSWITAFQVLLFLLCSRNLSVCCTTLLSTVHAHAPHPHHLHAHVLYTGYAPSSFRAAVYTRQKNPPHGSVLPPCKGNHHGHSILVLRG